MKAAPIWEPAHCDPVSVRSLAQALDLEPVVARLLCLRGLGEPGEAQRFLSPSLDQLHDPWALTDLRRAVERLLAAVARSERVAVHGDYDVDGITSTVILRRCLEMLGADVVHFIPDRLKDGYGLLPATIERLHAEGARVVVSVDCGIRAADAARRAAELGVDLIVTDHHEPDTALPPAFAVVNPKRRDCSYPDKNLAGVGVALKLVQALCSRSGREKWLPAFVKIAAIGTLADVVPLVGENRVIAKVGLDLLSRGPHKVGLRALLEASGLTSRTIDSYHIGFVLAPRVNAAGRMSTPDIATRLLLASDEALAGEARELAEQLNAENTRRQQEEAAIVAEARRIVESDPDVGARTVLVVAGPEWHRGVIGIVASKLVEHFHRPAIVLSVEDDVAHGSCRSIPGFDILAALDACAPMLLRHGGHKAAAGLALEASRIKEFRSAINAFADERLGPDDLRPRIYIEDTLTFRGISGRLAGQLASLAPFGPGNPRPVFSATGVEIVDGPRRLKERHYKMALRHEGRVMRAIAWRGADRHAFLESHRALVDVAFSLDRNEFNGETYLELSLCDIRPCAGPSAVSDSAAV
ncbi:MAG TPA: single-stranded-DNA-specific exonuclease RecJ [Vicinamibacterales bacterium]|nr:single-stranded-DNA-specific exonuclease RecJ [Vicinamibacterales bacterium]